MKGKETKIMEVKSIINKEVFKELGFDNFSNKNIVVIIFMILLLWFIRSLIIHYYFVAISTVIYSVLFYGLLIFKVKNNIKNQINKIKEITGETEVTYKLKFNEENILRENLFTGEVITIKYDSLKKLKKTNNYYILFTKAKQFIPILKKELDEKHEEELVEFLRKKMR